MLEDDNERRGAAKDLGGRKKDWIMYYVYILTNSNNKVMYVGVTNDLQRRLYEHKNELIDGFTRKYHVHNLVYYESHKWVKDAILREKQIKGLLKLAAII